jgi:uncharacterized protein YhbP (UPF0306 family)
MDLKQLIKDYLEEARMLQVATSKNDQPWVCTVYFAYDQDFNIYWISKPSRRHSEEIADNANAAGVIVLPHTPGDKVRGIQFEGVAEKLANPEQIKESIGYYEKRYNRPGIGEDMISGKNEHVLYRIKPRLIVLFDELNFPDDPRRELKLSPSE